MTNKKIILALFIILLVGTFLRFWQLNSIPPGLWPDEAMNANDAFDTLQSKNYKLFYPDNNGREGLFMWLITFSFSIFGVSIWSMRAVSALIGVITILGTFLLTKELFWDNEKNKQARAYLMGLMSSFLIATSFWHINFSRISFRAIMAPMVLVYSFYFLLKGFRTKKIINFIFSGIFFGLGFYTYISFRIAPAILLVVLVLLLFYYLQKRKLNFYFKSIAALFSSIFITALPIGIYFLRNINDFMGRTNQVSIFNSGNFLFSFFKSTLFHLGMFNFYGDPNWRHNFSGSPMLSPLLGVLFITGIIFLIKKLISTIREKDFQLMALYGLPLIWFFIMLLPGILTTEGIPHSLRVISVIPSVYILITFGCFKVYDFLVSKKGLNKKLVIILFLIVIGISSFCEFNKYFYKWAKNPEVAKGFTEEYVEIGNHLNSLPEKTQKYVMINEPKNPLYGISIAAQTPIFIERTKFLKNRAQYLKFEELNQIKIDDETIIIPMYPETSIQELKEKFPEGEINKIGKIFIFEIKK